MCFRSSGASCHGDSGGGMFVKEKDRYKNNRIQKILIAHLNHETSFSIFKLFELKTNLFENINIVLIKG